MIEYTKEDLMELCGDIENICAKGIFGTLDEFEMQYTKKELHSMFGEIACLAFDIECKLGMDKLVERIVPPAVG